MKGILSVILSLICFCSFAQTRRETLPRYTFCDSELEHILDSMICKFYKYNPTEKRSMWAAGINYVIEGSVCYIHVSLKRNNMIVDNNYGYITVAGHKIILGRDKPGPLLKREQETCTFLVYDPLPFCYDPPEMSVYCDISQKIYFVFLDNFRAFNVPEKSRIFNCYGLKRLTPPDVHLEVESHALVLRSTCYMDRKH